MAKSKRDFVANQVFIGLPWKTVRPKYERCIGKLEEKYPLYLTIVGKDDEQTAENLFETIKDRIASSSSAIFDATGGNANVSLEFGYAEGIGVERCIFLSGHKASHKGAGVTPIISDLTGLRRVQYSNEAKLLTELDRFCQRHAFVISFERAIAALTKRKSRAVANRTKKLAVRSIRIFDGVAKLRRAEFIQKLKAEAFTEPEIEIVIKGLHGSILYCSPGRFSDISLA